MTVTLERYEPVLDVSLRVIEELVRNGEAVLEVPLRFPEAVGLAVDTRGLLHRLDPSMKTELFISGKMATVEVPSSSANSGRRLEMKFTEDDFLCLSRELFDTTLSDRALLDITPDQKPQNLEKSRISVMADENKNGHDYSLQSPIVSLLKENGIQLPPPTNKIALSIAYHSPSGGLPFYTTFQCFSPLNIRQAGSKTFRVYPVSSREEHLLPFYVWQYVANPSFWHGWGSYKSLTFYMLSSGESLEELAKKLHKDIKDIQSKIEQSRQVCYKMMEALIEGGSLDPLFDKLKVPNEYREILLSASLPSLLYLTKPGSLKDPGKYAQLKNLVRRYNEQYAIPLRKRAITAEEVASLKRVRYN